MSYKRISDDLNQCASCDFISNEYLITDEDTVCPVCKSTDYYILEELDQWAEQQTQR